MITQTVHATGNLREAILLFLDDIREWKASCIGKYSGQPPSDIHDQLSAGGLKPATGGRVKTGQTQWMI